MRNENNVNIARRELPQIVKECLAVEITYLSLLMRSETFLGEPVKNVVLLGFEEHAVDTVEHMLGMSVTALTGVTCDQVDKTGLYIVKSPEAQPSESVLGSIRTGNMAHPINGLARIVCR